MRHSARIALVLLTPAIVAACSDTTAPVVSPTQAKLLRPAGDFSSQVIPNEYVVVLKRGVADVTAAADRARAAGGHVSAEWHAGLHGYAATLTAAALNDLLRDPDIDWIQPNQVLGISGQETCQTYANCSWGLDRIDQASLPLDLTYNYPSNTASNVHAYIIDTGILTTHTEFGGRASWGADYGGTTPPNTDCNGHGTHVSGTVGGTTYGVAKGVNLVAVKVLDCTGSGTTQSVVNGVNWVTANAVHPAVANMSLGGGPDPTLDAAVAASINAGVTYAIAAGNSGANACNYSPADVPAAITVGATGNDASGFIPPQNVDTRASFSNFGSCVDIFAPGVYILSSYNTSNTATAILSGTSMATPHVTGVAALYLAQNPSATSAQVASALVANATNGVVSNPGTGSPNKLLSMAFLNGVQPPPNQPPVAHYTITCVPGTCTLDATSSTDDHGIVSYAWQASIGGRPPRTGPVITRVWDGAGSATYNETLTVTDGGGLTNSITQQVVIPPPGSQNHPPTATINSPANNASFTQGQTVTFTGSGNDTEDGTLTGASLTWTSNIDGAIGTGTSFTKNNLSPGHHTITLTAHDSQNATGTAMVSITINVPANNPPTAAIQQPANNSGFTQGQSVSFQGTGSDPEDGTLTGASLVWTSNRDGQIGTGTSFSTSSLSAGTHTITLTAKDSQGATGTASITITINAKPTAAIQQPTNNSTFTQGQSVSFQGTGSDPEDGTLTGGSLVWTSSRDGQIGTGTSFSSSTLSVGVHTITLTATDSKGATGTAQVSITVNTAVVDQPPVAAFTVTCVSGSCTLNASTSTDDHGIVSYVWTTNVPARVQKTGVVITRYYDGPAGYQETLTVTDTIGQKTSITKTIVIPP